MVRRLALLLPVLSLILPCIGGCGADTKPDESASASGVSYGPHEMPPPDQTVRKAGKAGRSPGAPPIQR